MLKDILIACVILNNMIVEDESAPNVTEDFEYKQLNDSSHELVSHRPTTEFSEFI